MKLYHIAALTGLAATFPIAFGSAALAQAGRSELACMQDLKNIEQRVRANQNAFTAEEQARIKDLLRIGETKCESEGDRSFMAVSKETEFLRQKLEQAEANAGTAPSRTR